MRIHEYSLARDVLAGIARPRQPASMWAAPPLVVMNNFSGDREELRLATALFQGLFPAINVQTVKLSSCQARFHLSHFFIPLSAHFLAPHPLSSPTAACWRAACACKSV